MPTSTLAHATEAVTETFPPPQLPGALLRSLQAGAALVRWKESRRPGPCFPLVQGQAFLHIEGMRTTEWGAIEPDEACRWIEGTAPLPMQPPPACHHLLLTVLPLSPCHALTREVCRALLGHCREWMTAPDASYPLGLVLEQLMAPTPRVFRHPAQGVGQNGRAHQGGAGPGTGILGVLYPQAHIPPMGTSNRLSRLGVQRCVEAAHAGGVVERWLTLCNLSTAQGHWYLHQLLFLPQPASKHRRQDPYASHQERLGTQSFPQPLPPALPQGQGQEALLLGPPLDATTAVQQRGRHDADGAEPDRKNCEVAARTAACRHLARHTTGLSPYRPAGRTALASTVAAVTMGAVAAWPAHFPPHVPHQGARPCQPDATHAPTTPLTAEQLHAVAAALLADGGEHFIHYNGRHRSRAASRDHNRTRPSPGAPRCSSAPASRNRTAEPPPPGPQQGEALVMQAAGYQAVLHGHAGGYRSHVTVEGNWTIWHGTIRQQAFPPHVDWQQARTQAYYMVADPWPLAVLLHTISTPSRPQEPGLSSPPTLVWSPDQEGRLRAAWHGDPIWATDVPDLHAGPITQAHPAAILVVAQRGQQSPKWVVCMFKPADAHIAICDPQRLPGPEATIHVADCACVIIKRRCAGGDQHTLLLQARLKDHGRAAKPGCSRRQRCFLLTWGSSWWSRPRCTTGSRPSTICRGGASPTTKSAQHTGRTGYRRTRSTPPSTVSDLCQQRGPSMCRPLSRPWRRTRSRLPTCPATRHRRALSASWCPSLLQGEPWSPPNAPFFADKFCTSGPLIEHLAWHAVHPAAPAEDREAASGILQQKARRSCGTPPAPSAPPPPPVPGNAAVPEGGQAAANAPTREEAPLAEADPGTVQGSIPARLVAAPLWAPLGAGSPERLAPVPPRTWRPQHTPWRDRQ